MVRSVLAPPDSPEQAIALLAEQGIALRMRKIARLDKAGMTPEQIGVELAKNDPTWSHDLVLALMGTAGDELQRSTLGPQYAAIYEDISMGNLMEPESDIKELMAYAMQLITTYIKMAPTQACATCKSVPKDALDAAFKVLKAGGLGLGENVSIVEYRMDAETRDVLRQVMGYKRPASRLGPMIEAEFSGKDF